MKHYLVIDIGTGNSRVGLIDQNNEILELQTIENTYYIDEEYEDAQYFSPSYWEKCLLPLCKSIVKNNKDVKIDGITSSGARESIVLINKKGEAFYGLPNIDNRGREWVKEIKETKKIYKKTGRWVSEDFPAMKLVGLRKKKIDIYNEIDTFTSLSEWVAFLFTKLICIEPSQACETQLYDIGIRKWSTELQTLYGIDNIKMPKLVNGATFLANVDDSMKSYLNVDYDIPFIVGGADTQVALMGANIEEGNIGIVSGTTSPIVTITSKKYYDYEERCWTDSFIGGNLFQIETNPGVTGLNYQRIRKLLFDNVSYEDLEAALQQVTSIKCTASFSSLNFEKACGFKAGGFFMKPPVRSDLHRIDLAWAIVGDMACSIYYQYKQLNLMYPTEHTYILGCGGGFQSKILCQHIADLTNKTLKLPYGYAQSSILGCAKLCNTYYEIEKKTIKNDYICFQPRKIL